LREAIQLNPNETLAHVNLGNLLDEIGKEDDAAIAYQEAIKIEPKNVHAHYNLGLVYAEQGKLKKANDEFTTVLKIDPEYEDAFVQQKLLQETEQ
jgi:Tfp pilus assembly protein PilF